MTWTFLLDNMSEKWEHTPSDFDNWLSNAMFYSIMSDNSTLVFQIQLQLNVDIDIETAILIFKKFSLSLNFLL